MFLQDNTFKNHIDNVKSNNLHKSYDNVYDTLIEKHKCGNSGKNIIFYGPSGVGKYSQMLYFLSKYTNNDLTYERKITIPIKNGYYVTKISDIHYEIDMSMLGCNSKSNMHYIYNHIIETVDINIFPQHPTSKSKSKYKFIVCKEFHLIANDLLDIFYTYMTNIHNVNSSIYFILLTENISFLPNSIYNACECIRYPRPTLTNYKKVFPKTKHLLTKYDVDNNIYNTLYLKHENMFMQMKQNKFSLCNDIVDFLLHGHKTQTKINLFELREMFYKLVVYNLQLDSCIYYILKCIWKETTETITIEKEFLIVNSIIEFYKQYQNKYRSIYHLEKMFLNIFKILHEI